MTEESQPEAGAADDGVVGESSTGAADESQDEERGEDANNGGESDAAAKTEDPAVVALKEEIAALESSLKSKRSTLMYTKDQLEEYSKAGYARKVAEMENMRRIRSVSSDFRRWRKEYLSLLKLMCYQPFFFLCCSSRT